MSETGPIFGPYLSGMYDAPSQLSAHITRRMEERVTAGHEVNDRLATSADVKARQETIRQAAVAGLGGLPEHSRLASPPHVVGKVRAGGFTIEKIMFESSPSVVVTGNVYVPDETSRTRAGVLFCCGHSEKGKAAPSYQAACARMARNGLVVLVIDPIGQGERKSYLDTDGSERVQCNSVEHTYAGIQSWWVGDSIARYFIHDARCAIDYLAARDDVDARRIGVVGNSGGATLISWLMMIEPGLAAATLGCFVTDRLAILSAGKSQDAEQHVMGGTLRGIDHEDFLIAMAPRPAMVLSANYDYFPIEGTIRTVQRARRAYRILGAEDQLKHVRVNDTHGFHPALARAATRFMIHHLHSTPDPVIDDEAPALLSEEDLCCTRAGQVLIEEPTTRRVFDLNLQRHGNLRCPLTQRSGDNDGLAAKGWLADRVYAHRCVPDEFYPRWLPVSDADNEDEVIRPVFWWSEVDLLGAGAFVQPLDGDITSLVIALFDHGTHDVHHHRNWLAAQITQQRAVLVLDVRGTGALTPNPLNPHPADRFRGTMYKLMTNLFWLDDSLAAGRVFDILRAVEFVRTDPEIALNHRPIALYGTGMGAFHGYLAAALEPAITRAEFADLPLDPTEIVTNRYYPGGERQWQCVIPGMATHASTNDLRPLLKDRELTIAN